MILAGHESCRRRSRIHSSKRKRDNRSPRRPRTDLAFGGTHEIVTLPAAFDSACTSVTGGGNTVAGVLLPSTARKYLTSPLYVARATASRTCRVAHQLGVFLVVVKRNFDDRRIEFVVDVKIVDLAEFDVFAIERTLVAAVEPIVLHRAVLRDHVVVHFLRERLGQQLLIRRRGRSDRCCR